jgi:putative transposase
MQRPGAATVALLISRIVLPKAPWLARVGVDVDWPMHGIPKVLHLDNAAEFKSRALRNGCSQYGIELMYRPVGRPHFGGHIERMNRTLMERLRGLPGATGNSTVGRPERRSAERAALTLEEFERWLCMEVAQRYHNRPHRGLMGASPASAWSTLVQTSPPRLLPDDAEQALRFLIQFMPMEARTVQNNGLTLFYIRYWHPIFATWREQRKQVTVRYHPEDLSRIFATVDGRRYVEARYADLRHPSISLWEQRAACRILRGEGTREPSERLIFAAIDKQRQIIAQAVHETRKVRRATAGMPNSRAASKPGPWASPAPQPALPGDEIDYSKKPTPFPVEFWEPRR